MALTHPYATGVAVYPALFHFDVAALDNVVMENINGEKTPVPCSILPGICNYEILRARYKGVLLLTTNIALVSK